MSYWILPWNAKDFDLTKCLSERGCIEWLQRRKYAVGDIVFIYRSGYCGQIVYKFEVEQIDIPYQSTFNRNYLSADALKKLNPDDKFTRLALIAVAPENGEHLSYAALKRAGLTSTLQGPQHLKDDVLNHILSHFDAK
jgi:hypothetical protein